MLPLPGSRAALGRDTLRPGSPGMEQQSAASPADGGSHVLTLPSATSPGPQPPSAAALVCSGEFGNAAAARGGVTHVAGVTSGSMQIPSSIPTAAERLVPQRCFGTNKQIVRWQRRGPEFKPGFFIARGLKK